MELSRPFIRLPFNFDAERLSQEVSQFDASCWMAHPNRLGGNTAVPLVSQGGQDNDEFSGRMLPTPHLLRCEYIQQIMAQFDEVFARSRLMKLAAGAEVSPHVDFNYHWYNRVRIHIPVITNPDVIFYCGEDQLHMQAGECWIFDSWRNHNVINRSPHDRVHLVLDTAGSAAFWQRVRAMQAMDNDEVEAQNIAYQPGLKVQIKTERYNVAPVMAPGELEAIARELTADFRANPDNDPTLVTKYAALLSDLAKDWRQTYLQYGFESAGLPHYQALLNRCVQSMDKNPRALVVASTNVGVNPIIMQRILRAALFPDQRAAFSAA
ncbi:MAG: aspartyl/asparaginyl beta-hydroxylase domain-containing protein [Gammaproteobacteria bacterium]|nr:aspartyl/asparaginyl beta-hydroxylase domain-containing protein [Gammaproteobacteria bacterium]